MTNHLRELEGQRQAVWLDFLDRPLLTTGALEKLINEDGLKGLTSNPTIFEKAIGEGDAYDASLRSLMKSGGGSAEALYERLAIADIQRAADIFRPTWDRLGGQDGYVSMEVSPLLAMDTEGTVAEARRLWREVDRPNLMIKVPGTMPGVPAIRQLISEGINVNVTLLFGLDAYLAVAEAHLAGLEALKAAGGDLGKTKGVASFFVSRIDTKIDKAIDERAPSAAPEQAGVLKRLRGHVATANAKIAYQRYLEMIATPRWKALADAGAAPQRLLWASTGVKDPAYPETHYADNLIGADTIDTLPPKTMDAFRDHGRVAPTLTEGVEVAKAELVEAERLGLDLDGVTKQLVVDGVRSFSDSYAKLLQAISRKREQIAGAA
jgi:transaldolase/glucose-6-phosphate isomerase